MPIKFKSALMRLQHIESEILKRVEKMGGKPAKSDRGWRAVSLSGQIIEYSCREKHKQVRRILTAEEIRWSMPGSKNWAQELEPTGVLTFDITEYTPDRLRKHWRDTDELRLEDCIPDIVSAFPKVALSMIEHHRRLEEESKRRACIAEKSAEERTRKWREEKRWQRFVQIAQERRDILCVEEYLAVIRQRASTPDKMIGKRSVSDWIAWVDTNLTAWKSRRESPEVFEIIDWVGAGETPAICDRGPPTVPISFPGEQSQRRLPSPSECHQQRRPANR